MGPGHEADEVLVSFVRSRQPDQVMAPFLARRRLAVVAGTGGHIDLGPEDRLDPRPVRLLVEIDRPDHPPVVGERYGGHPHPGHLAHEVLDLYRPVEKTVLGMQMQVDELAHRALPDAAARAASRKWLDAPICRQDRPGQAAIPRTGSRGAFSPLPPPPWPR